jgi:hypothetical protein
MELVKNFEKYLENERSGFDKSIDAITHSKRTVSAI